jgi:chemosensory pili system protein ChpC
MNAIVQNFNEIRGLMINISNGRALLPNATVSEIITAATPEPVPNAPDWLLGRVRWRGWRVPLFSLSLLTGIARSEGAINAKVTILKAVGRNPRMPYIAMLCQGFPRLTTISPDVLIPTEQDDSRPPGVISRVLVRDDLAMIPDLYEIERMVDSVLSAAAA